MKLNNLLSSCFHRGETKSSNGNGGPVLPSLSEESSPRNEESLANQVLSRCCEQYIIASLASGNGPFIRCSVEWNDVAIYVSFLDSAHCSGELFILFIGKLRSLTSRQVSCV